MRRRLKPGEYAELRAFVAVAEACSFRRAAAELGLTPSTLSHAVRAFEDRVGQRLLNRTTRAVTVTEAGAKLLQDLRPVLARLDDAVAAVGIPEGAPVGTVRLAAPRLAIQMLVEPAVRRLARDCPHVTVDVRTAEWPGDLTDGFDLGIQYGNDVAQDMVAVALTKPFTAAVVGSPGYFADHPPPLHPADLVRHRCIGCLSGPAGALYRWTFERDGETVVLDVGGTLVTDDADLMLNAAIGGVGLWHGIDRVVQPMIEDGRLLRVLTDWSPSFPGFHLYYAAGAPLSPAVRAVADALRSSG
ncbi:DNA-binding transcriptional regulator, LysR family [Azospirillum oryzae]|uniref:DNA-binding transcriptional regulator, LysR family n=1 Tax=Azospirillum oryzae TaxID=286727 RepID=A0A1X7DQS2_9PROT|nr:LysR family transcriptional regulator [Azospirillum oryzae]SMF19821.1 DNA-binding transcriptional regulator, LysR family [Azospirillum oryzae]